MSGVKSLIDREAQSQTKDETETPVNPLKVFSVSALELPRTLTQQLTLPLPTTNPEPLTHYELGSCAQFEEASIDRLSVLGATG